MIDFETDIFDLVYRAVNTAYPTAFITGEYVAAPASFPCVSLMQIDSVAFRRTQDTSSNENHAQVTFELNVYSNKVNGKKSEAKAIAKVVDDMLLTKGFTRIMLNPIPNVEDATIYRIVGRYTAVIGTDGTIYRR